MTNLYLYDPVNGCDISDQLYIVHIVGVVDKLLSWPGLIPLSRMSYAAYLLHPIMMMVHMYSKRALVYIADYDIVSS